MQTLQTANITAAQLDVLDEFARSTAGPELRDLLLSLSRCMRAGDEIVVVDEDETLTPNKVAERLGMSRTHLYKLLDRGLIPSHRVGRDRRIRLSDLAAFEQQRQSDRRELAERFAHRNATTAAVDDAIADLI